MGKIWAEVKELCERQSHVLGPLQENMQDYFQWRVQEDGKEYWRRPQIGLKLDLADGKVLAIRPGWQPSSHERGQDDISGVVIYEKVHLELLAPGKLLSLRLEPGNIYLCGNVFLDMNTNKAHLQDILKAAHHLLTAPWETFSSQADRCCCCHKGLSDIVSRTRGIGPECIRWFKWFDMPPASLKHYQEKYRSIDEPWVIPA